MQAVDTRNSAVIIPPMNATRKTKTIECGKCNGLGEIAAYSGIAGGICFACGGTGKKTVSANHQPSIKFTCVYAGVDLFTIKARSESQALMIAITKWRQNRTLPAYANVTSEEQISVVAE